MPYKNKEDLHAKQKEWYVSNAEEIKAARKQYRKDNPDKIREYGKKWRAENQDKVRNSHLKRKFGITLDDFNSISLEQNDCCWLCGKDAKARKRSRFGPTLHVDHCHTTNRIRGLICGHCNRNVLPILNDDPEFVDRIKEYLTRETNYGFVPERKEK